MRLYRYTNINQTAFTTPGTYWSFCPSLGAAVAFLVFFFLTFVAHVAQGVFYRKAYTWVISMVYPRLPL
jgi:uncharacterized membrane protein